jgi:hypothetical protein
VESAAFSPDDVRTSRVLGRALVWDVHFAAMPPQDQLRGLLLACLSRNGTSAITTNLGAQADEGRAGQAN